MADTAITGVAAAAQTNEPLIRVEGLRKSFGSLEVLKGIDLSVNPGEVVTIIGASGSGKSTFLRCLNLLETPDAATSGSTVRTLRPSAAISISCARTSAWCFRALTCSTTWTCSTTARSRPSRSKR